MESKSMNMCWRECRIARERLEYTFSNWFEARSYRARTGLVATIREAQRHVIVITVNSSRCYYGEQWTAYYAKRQVSIVAHGVAIQPLDPSSLPVQRDDDDDIDRISLTTITTATWLRVAREEEKKREKERSFNVIVVTNMCEKRARVNRKINSPAREVESYRHHVV